MLAVVQYAVEGFSVTGLSANVPITAVGLT
jgi:hypothetical protein